VSERESELQERREEQVRQRAAELLKSGNVGGILALRRIQDHVVPCLFTEVDDLASLDISTRYAVAGVAERLLRMAGENRLGIVARGCGERHLIELAKKKSIDITRVEIIGLACTESEARECHCVKPYPRRVDAGESIGDVDFLDHEALAHLLEMNISERRRFWTEMFNRCIKCFGCRNSCPLCNCDDCRLEEARWVRVGEIPPEYPSFHLIRAVHLADKCIGCTVCERACPMVIPLSKLHQLIRQDVKRLFGYEAGLSADEKSPLLTDLDKGPLEVTAGEL
jgi:formate dehydrogenase subunit beta